MHTLMHTLPQSSPMAPAEHPIIQRARRLRWIGLVSLALAAACSPSSLVGVDAPSGVVDPSTIRNSASADAFYRQAVGTFISTYGGGAGFGGNDFVTTSGIFTDELSEAEASELTCQTCGIYGIDERFASNPLVSAGYGRYWSMYSALHQARTQLFQARQALALYDPNAPQAWYGRLAALQAYTYVMFGELFCSGIPLSEVPLEGASFATRGFTTQELFEKAIALFDTAATLGGDSTLIVNLAKVGKARALLALNRMPEAAAAVHDVPDDFRYNLVFGALGNDAFANALGNHPAIMQVIDHEGENGLVWSADPRPAIRTGSLHGGMQMTGKYAVSGGSVDIDGSYPATPLPLADGLEARLIEAEADLKAGGSAWLTILNHLRATCVGGAACSPYPGLPATLPAMTDPGTPAARLDSLMKERAMWLYVTGHRQGDLRRLAHVYGRAIPTLWPTGTYTTIPAGSPWPGVYPSLNDGKDYGADVVFTPPPTEANINPQYSGCYDTQP